MRLTDLVVKQLEEDFKTGDITAIEELIDSLLTNEDNVELLNGYLPED